MYKNQPEKIKKLSPPWIFMLLLLYGCAVPLNPDCVKESKTYCQPDGIFTSRWYDYYERALSCMEGECYQAALSDLNKTSNQRFEDQRMARTFGMHFIDYFPHRETGLIHYLMGDYDAAKSELELSIQQYPSEKAFFYMDKVRKKIMEREKKAISVPRLILETPIQSEGTNEVWTRENPVIISGKAEDEQYISEITLKGKPVFLETSAQTVTFKEHLKLDQGRHEVDIIARNLRNGEAGHQIIIHVDRCGPLIIVETYDPDIGITGWLYDESGETVLFADGKNIPVPKGKKVPFSVPIKSSMKHITLLARDKLGNETYADINADVTSVLGSAPVLLADAGAVPMFVKSENIKPEIILNMQPDQETVFLENIYIKGKAKGNTIESLTINGTPVLNQTGHVIFFNYFVRLEKGKNRVTIRATDKFGNTGIKDILIIRQVPEVFKLKYRYCLAMHPFDNMTDDRNQIAKYGLFQNIFLKQLVALNRFQIMTREKSASPMFEQENLKTPDAALMGNIYKTRSGIEITARLADIRSGEILAIKDAYSEAGDRSALAGMAEKLAEKFHRKFPLMDAAVTEMKEGKLIVTPETWTPEKGDIKMKWPLIIYRQKNQGYNPVREEPSGSDTKMIGDAAIHGMTGENYLVRPDNGQKIEIKEGDRVVTQ